MQQTIEQFDKVATFCREIFVNKLKDYGSAWRILRLSSVTDQLFIKASRIRSIEIKGIQKIEDGIKDELAGLVNYSVIALIQNDLGISENAEMSFSEAIRLYDQHLSRARSLMIDKNHDYDEAWRSMRQSSYTDLILMKINRIKQIEDNNGDTLISEGIDSNYIDIINYSVFGLIRVLFE